MMKISKTQLIADLKSQHYYEIINDSDTTYSLPDGHIKFVFKGNDLNIEDEKGERIFETRFISGN